MAIELSKEARALAVTSIERYFQTERDERIGNIAASALLGFFLQEIGPSIYNRAVADVQAQMLARVNDIDIDNHEDEFVYWQQQARPRR